MIDAIDLMAALKASIKQDADSLNATLASCGLTTTDAGHGRKNIILDGHVVFTGRANEVWAWLRRTGRVQ